MGARVLIETLSRLGTLTPIPQPDAEATLAPRLRKVDGWLDWREPAPAIVGRVHGCNPWPGAATEAPAGRLTIWRARAVAQETDRSEERRGGKEGRVRWERACGRKM